MSSLATLAKSQAGKRIFWFRQDLRLADNPGFYQAALNGAVIAIFILDESQDDFKMGGASRIGLYHSLQSLQAKLANKLNIYQGRAQDIILALAEQHAIDAVYWSRCYEPWRVKQDLAIQTRLAERHIDCTIFNASLLWEPSAALKQDGSPYKVFTPFYKNACLHAPQPRVPLSAPPELNLIKDATSTLTIDDLPLRPAHTWYSALEQHWVMGEEGAHQRLADFVEHGLANYKEGRNFPEKNNVSRLSSSLHFGELSPNQVWFKVREQSSERAIPMQDIEHFLSELGWRDFSYYLLSHFPSLPRENFQKKFNNFPWQTDDLLLTAWKKGQTGYPIIDAGMRELWQTGYMHNRVRMIVGSFLVKNLLLHWHQGEDWFWDCLVDADLANNSASWQWVAGSGADAAPFFRIFNPVLQGAKFDPQGLYTKRFVPELINMPVSYLFRPWEAPAGILQEAGVVLGKTYPQPIVDFRLSRLRALEAFRSCK